MRLPQGLPAQNVLLFQKTSQLFYGDASSMI